MYLRHIILFIEITRFVKKRNCFTNCFECFTKNVY